MFEGVRSEQHCYILL